MEIIINIPDELYDRKMFINVIRNGTPLPKGHGRLVDADMLEKKVEKHRKMLKISEYDRDLVLHYTNIEMAPTIIEADKEG